MVTREAKEYSAGVISQNLMKGRLLRKQEQTTMLGTMSMGKVEVHEPNKSSLCRDDGRSHTRIS